MDKITETSTLHEVRTWLRERTEKGERCPCCKQMAKVYKRTIHHTMAADLISCYRAFGQGKPFKLPKVISGHSGDFSKLRYWRIIEEASEELREDGSPRNGWWQITEHGELWIHRAVSVPKYAYIYDSRLLRLGNGDHDNITIDDALGTKFNYDELMKGI